MIKYANIEGFNNLGEIGSNLYQWIEDTEDTRVVILVRTYDTDTKIWSGYLMNETKIIENANDIIINSDMSLIKNAKRIESFKEFIKGHHSEEQFNEFEEL